MRLLALLLVSPAWRRSSGPCLRELYLNAGVEAGVWKFVPALPDVLLTHDATHGVQFVDVTRRPVV